jgi:WD40 repeat protein
VCNWRTQEECGKKRIKLVARRALTLGLKNELVSCLFVLLIGMLGHKNILRDREMGRMASPCNLGFSQNRVRAFSRSSAKIDHYGCINCAEWSENGDLLYTGSDDKYVKVWRLGSAMDGVKLAKSVLTKHRGNIFSVKPKPDDPSLIVSGAADGTVRSNFLESRYDGVTLLASDDFM